MSTDSTELTFVRCPSCRSLVPAVSTRCRMCGAALEAAPAEEEEEQTAQGRVRQRTADAGQDLTGAAEKMRQALKSEEQAGAAETEAVSESDQGGFEDPLSAYIEEVTSEPKPQKAEDDTRASQFEEPAHMDNGKDAVEPFTAEPEPVSSPEPKVIVETGGRRSKKGSGLSFGLGKKGEAKKQPQPEPAPAKEAKPEVKEETPQKAKVEERPEKRNKRRRKKSQTDIKEAQKQQQPPQRSENKMTQKGKKRTGRLYGWLVSHDDPLLSAIELREGQFFVTSNQLKPNDLVIDHGSVSTPHAILAISQDGGFRVRDLMSDNGVYLKRNRDSSFQRFDDEESLEHGDWIQFGEVAYLVSLLPNEEE